jgi:hypothetical protein
LIGGRAAGVNEFQRRARVDALQDSIQNAKGEGVAGSAQSQAEQKLQSISAHDPNSLRFPRQSAVQIGSARVSTQRDPMSWTNGWPAHLDWTAVSHSEQSVTTDLSSQARNCPPPQMQAICGLHSLGHQHASVRGAQRSLAAMHSQAPIAAQGIVVEASRPPLSRLPPQAARQIVKLKTPTRARVDRIRKLA